MAVPPLVGRETEIEALHDLLFRAESQGAALALFGEPGVGKSALLEQARQEAEDRGFAVLATAGVQAETSFPFAALHRLLQPLLHRLEELPPPQRAALAGAFGIEQAPAPVFLVGLATLALLGERAASSPLLLLIDDTQFLDPLSAQVIAFVARRLDADPIALLSACRKSGRGKLGEVEMSVLKVEPLDQRSSESLLDAEAPELPPKIRARVLAEAAGNPLALLELPVAWRADRDTAPLPIASLPLTARLEEAFSERYRELDAETRALLLVAALDEEGALEEVSAAARLLRGGEENLSWEPAVEANLVTVQGGFVQFRHSLLRSAIRQTATAKQRRQAHGALAEVLAGQPDRALWHRAASRSDPDERLASQLDEAAASALARGALATAKTALERASKLSEDSEKKGRRLLGAAELAHDLGDPDAVSWLLEKAEAVELCGAERTRLAWLREEQDGSWWSGESRIRSLIEIAEALAADGEMELAIRCLLSAARRIWWTTPSEPLGDLVSAAAERLEVDEGDPRLLAILASGDPIKRGASVLERIAEIDPETIADGAGLQLIGSAACAVWAHDEALEFLEAAVERLRSEGQLGLLAQALASQAWAAMHLSQETLAAEAADEAIRFAEETSQPHWATVARLAQAALLSERGRFGDAERLLAEAESTVVQAGAHSMIAMAQFARGRGAVAHQRYEQGLDHLGRALRFGEIGYHPFVAAWGLADMVEATVNLGDHAAAAEYEERLESLAAETQSPMLTAELQYARPLLAADEEAEALYEEALASELMMSWPDFRGRLLLAYGRWLRRQRRIAESRGPLRAARDTFDALAYYALADKARQELRASGETSRRRSDDARDQLTPQELKIAEMAAAGLSNKEIGRELFLSHRTVESHLYRMFPKLGITSRAELRDALPEAVVAEGAYAEAGNGLSVP